MFVFSVWPNSIHSTPLLPLPPSFTLSLLPWGSDWLAGCRAHLDKYSQIYRILLPITNVINQIPSLMDKPSLRSYIEDEFGSEDNLYKEILGDFFRHGFDGSGADNVSYYYYYYPFYV